MSIAAPPGKIDLTLQACEHFRNGFSGDFQSVRPGLSYPQDNRPFSWRIVAVPPGLYPTHSVSTIVRQAA
jgi:hypothetical protein